MDEIDQAQEINERHLEIALEEHRKRQPAGESNIRCEDCREPIPEARREAVAGCRRCIDCQTLLEHWSALQ
ncbi:MAG: hypothetical protein A2075_12135 [Geobacteraceae bacterium GWC2_58_44]|nr:MAG: hypothetical protein A2075_12135 [Geobacteraceae bacterium GWC2_58_44]HBG06311.1 conjugal transfer protein TraR [Geobacter sp.]